MNFYFKKLGYVMKQDPIIVHYALPLTSNCVSLCTTYFFQKISGQIEPFYELK